MPSRESLQAEISTELRGKRLRETPLLLQAILQGQVESVIDELLFFTPPSALAAILEPLERSILAGFPTATPREQASQLEFAVALATRMGSHLPRWNLADAARHGQSAFSLQQVNALARRTRGLALDLAGKQPQIAESLLQRFAAEAAVRFKAEAVPDPEAASRQWVGSTMEYYLDHFRQAVESSNLRRIADLRADNQTRSEISNDYAAFLPYTLHLGASFVTCNPPLVDIAWQADVERWNAVADRLIAETPQANGEELARRMTLEVVLSNMLQLRPIFLLTSGQTGCVSLQVNPKRHDDAQSMIGDANAIYAELRDRLGGSVPNVVFKLPATRAGLRACEALTSEGIGVNITVNFGLFQHLRFAEVIARGQSVFSVLSHMSGRLAFPVRDELLGKLGELAGFGIDEARARRAAAWSGVIVLKRLHQLLIAKGYDLSRVKPLIASMRVYEGDAYAGLPCPIPDISEVIGTGILTVFPNVRRAFDGLTGIALHANQIEDPVPDEVLPVLAHSELFRQAYYVSDPAWADDGEALRPARVLDLDDEAATAEWLPVRNTLNEFCKAYDVFVERIEGRRRA
jgi:Transaldolase/Fructose-6-phosphate aldolase